MATQLDTRKLFAGPRLRRLRVQLGLTQTRMADDLGLSVSYLNLIERNQRPLTAAVLLKMAQAYNLDLRQLTEGDADRALADVASALTGPALAGLDISRAELRDLVETCPNVAQAIVRLAAQGAANDPQPAAASPLEGVRRFILDRQNHFPTLEEPAEALADELRLSPSGTYAAIADRLRARHGLTVRVLPVEVMPTYLRRLDIHGRQLHLSEALDGASRTFQAAVQLALIEQRDALDALVRQAGFEDRAAERLLRQALAGYFAAALIMPYRRFHAAAEALGYDLELLQARFGAGFEQVAHRLTTLQRPGARGIPFFMIRVDRGAQVSKRFAAFRFAFAERGGSCPLWTLHHAFDRPGTLQVQLIRLEDGTRWVSLARTVRTYATAWGTTRPEFAVGLVCSVEHARGLAYARRLDLDGDEGTPIGPGCTACTRIDCRQRSAPLDGARLAVDERERRLSPFTFAD